MAKAQNIVTSITVEIAAPAAVVWDVLTDFPRYGEWNSFCYEASAALKVGEPINMRFRIPGTDITAPGVEYIASVEPNKLLSWEQRASAENKDAARRDQYIEELAPDRCTYCTTDIFLGLNADQIMREHGGWVKQAFDNVARDLKQRAEAIYASRPS